MSIFDPDKKVEKDKATRSGHYQSSQQPQHFGNEGNEYITRQAEGNNNTQEEADYDKMLGIDQANKSGNTQKGTNRTPENLDTSIGEIKNPDAPDAAEDSGIPGTGKTDQIGTASAGAGLGANKGRGTADFPGKESE